MNKSKKINLQKSILFGILTTLGFFFIFGIVTAVIKNPYFTRMTPVYWYDYVFLIANSILLGIYVTLYKYSKYNGKSNICAASGGFLGFLSLACPVCNQILIFLFGSTALLTYFAPLQPFFGVASIILLTIAVYYKYKKIKW